MSNLATTKNEETAELEVSNNAIGSILNLSGSVLDLPDLSESIEMPIDLMSDYWTPETPGEFKLVIFDRIDITDVLVKDEDDNDVIAQLKCAYFLEQLPNKDIKPIRNASKRLVGAILSAGVKRGAALKLTFMGKKKNATNSFKSDSWSVRPLLIQI